MKTHNRIGATISFLFLFLFAVSFIIPIVFVGLNSLKERTEYFITSFHLPRLPLHFQNIAAMIRQFGILRYYANTMQVLVASVCLVVVLSVMASYGYAKLNFRGKGVSYLLIIGTMVIPPQITLVPTYVIVAHTGLINSYLSVILVFGAFYLPNSILLMTAYFKTIPQDVIECADLEGCSYARKIVTIVTPLGAPIIWTTIILNSLFIWNDFFIPLILL